MPVPQQFGRGDRMGRGPYEKSGILRDTSLPPQRTVTEKFDIPFPVEEVKKGDKMIRTIASYAMTVTVELWYLPFGTKMEDHSFLWHKYAKSITISKEGK